LHKIKQDWNKI